MKTVVALKQVHKTAPGGTLEVADNVAAVLVLLGNARYQTDAELKKLSGATANRRTGGARGGRQAQQSEPQGQPQDQQEEQRESAPTGPEALNTGAGEEGAPQQTTTSSESAE